MNSPTIDSNQSTAVDDAEPNVDVLTTAPSLIPLPYIPNIHLQIFKVAISDIYRINRPRDFQLKAINNCAFEGGTFLVIVHNTEDGKLLVPLTVATLRRVHRSVKHR